MTAESGSKKEPAFLTRSLEDLRTGDPLPGALYIYAEYRFVLFRAAGAKLDRLTYDRLEFKGIKHLFIDAQDLPKFEEWARLGTPLEGSRNQKKIQLLREEVRRSAQDIFQAKHPDKQVTATLDSSRKLVQQILKSPYAVRTLDRLSDYARGTVDHSVNTGILSVYLAMQMGYAQAVILNHLAVGGILHDIGKSLIPLSDEDSPEEMERKLREHPEKGLRLLEAQDRISAEVRLIMAQHHEAHDGSGYPKGLRGSQIYELTRILSIANEFDRLVAEGEGELRERQRKAIQVLDVDLFKKFDPHKLEKALKILKLGV